MVMASSKCVSQIRSDPRIRSAIAPQAGVMHTRVGWCGWSNWDGVGESNSTTRRRRTNGPMTETSAAWVWPYEASQQ